MKYSELIRKTRLEKGLSKAELAKIVGCTERAVDYWENGQRNLTLENADKVFKALEVTVCIGKRKDKKIRNV